MKLLKDIAKNEEPSTGAIVEFQAVIGRWIKLKEAQLSTEIQCQICHGHDHYTPSVGLKDPRKVWMCANRVCESMASKSMSRATFVLPVPQRSLQWPLFCELNGIGDLYYDVKFENVEQSDVKRSYMMKFAAKPKGIILMQGEPGTGKTYAAMAICELFTRTNTSCLFMTQKQLVNNWLETFKVNNNFIEKVTTRNLIVIDDFGTGECSPAFLGFFMDLINTRMQWSDRGTVITTNLNLKIFSDFCGDALADRINTGQSFIFSGKSRRKMNAI